MSLRLQTLNQGKYFGFSGWAQSKTQTLKSRELSPHEGKRCHRRGLRETLSVRWIWRVRDVRARVSRGMGPLEARAAPDDGRRGSWDPRPPTPGHCILSTTWTWKEECSPQSLWRRVHPSNTDFSLVTLESPAESSWPSAYRTTRRWRTGVVSTIKPGAISYKQQ